MLVIAYTVTFGRKALLPIYVFVMLEGATYGFGLWWATYLYVWAVLYGAARLLRRNTSVLVWAVTAGFFGLGFGALCTIPYLAGRRGFCLICFTARGTLRRRWPCTNRWRGRLRRCGGRRKNEGLHRIGIHAIISVEVRGFCRVFYLWNGKNSGWESTYDSQYHF